MMKRLCIVLLVTGTWLGITVFGVYNIIEGIRERRLRDEPPVVGKVVSREPFSLLGLGIFSRSRITIEIVPSEEVVVAVTGRYLLDTVPSTVQFYYDGNPSTEVFLFAFEEDPLWIGLTCVVGLYVVVPFLMLLLGISQVARLRRQKENEL